MARTAVTTPLSVALLSVPTASKNMAGKSREEIALEKQMELERRLMDVSGQLNSGKKPVKTKRKFNRHVSECLYLDLEWGGRTNEPFRLLIINCWPCCFLQRRNLQRSSTTSPLASVPAVPPRTRLPPPPRPPLRTQVTPTRAERAAPPPPLVVCPPLPPGPPFPWAPFSGLSSLLTELTWRWEGRDQRHD